VKLSLPSPLVHHALKAALLVSAVQVPLTDIDGRHWAIHAASLTLAIIAGALLCMAYLHIRYTTACAYCTPVPAERRTPLHRLWLAYGRYGLVVMALLLLFLFVGLPLLSDGRDADADADTTFSATSQAVHFTLVLLLIGYLSARRFYQLNDPGRASSGELHTWIKTHAEGLIHRSFHLSLAAMLFALVTLFLPKAGPAPLISGLSLVFLALALFMDRQHTMSLCEKCVHEFRTDAPEYASARRRRFFLSHQLSDRGIFVALALMCGAPYIPEPWSRSASATAFLIMVAGMMLSKFHVSYQPWCPICHPGGGGGEDEETTPDPTGGHGRPVPVT
jgi:hypothetical protein